MNKYNTLRKNPKIWVCITFLLLSSFTSTTIAQSTVASGGGNYTSGGISVSYTIGQVFYSTNENSNIKISEGVQQPYEIQTANGIKEAEGIKLIMNVFPNPTKNDLTLVIENYNLNKLSFSLYDIMGKQLFSEQIINKSTQIKISSFPVSTYFLKIYDLNKEIKTFKIIKTN